MDSEKPEPDGPDEEDPRLAELLSRYTVPQPSETFVDDTMLKISLDAWEAPEPSPGFADRVMHDLEASPAGARPGPAASPLHRRYVVPALLVAAAAVLAFLLPDSLLRPRSGVPPFVEFGRSSAAVWDRHSREGHSREGHSREGHSREGHSREERNEDLLVPALYYPSAPRAVQSTRPTVVVR